MGISIESFWRFEKVYNFEDDEKIDPQQLVDLLVVVDKINDEIEFAVQQGDLKALKRNQEFGRNIFFANEKKVRDKMFNQPYFMTKDFLLWAKKLRYQIPEEMESLIFENGESLLTKSEAQEFGRLKKEKIKWNESIKASVMIGLWLKEIDFLVTHTDIENKIWSEFPNIPKSTIKNMIWKAIPNKFQNQGGAQKQKKD